MSMQQPERLLGNGFRASPISFGAMGMSEFYGVPPVEEDSLAVLERALELGVTMIDTADMYGRGHNEALIGRLLAKHRQEVGAGQIKIATKVGIERAIDDPYRRQINNSPAYIRKACENSLKRLQVERLDLYYMHRLDPQAELAETIGTLSELIKEGKVAQIGLCEVSPQTLKAAHQLHPIAALQTEYSLWTRDAEEAILPLCRELGIGFVAYSPLGRGFLSARYQHADMLGEQDFRRSLPRFQGENLEQNLALLPTLQQVADKLGATPAQVSLAWLLGRYEHLVVIPGTRNIGRLEENCASVKISLSADDVALLDATFNSQAVHGERYTEEGMKGLNA